MGFSVVISSKHKANELITALEILRVVEGVEISWDPWLSPAPSDPVAVLGAAGTPGQTQTWMFLCSASQLDAIFQFLDKKWMAESASGLAVSSRGSAALPTDSAYGCLF